MLQFRTAWFHHRNLGKQLRTASIDPAANHHAFGFPWRLFLLHLDVAAILANCVSVQSGRLPDLRVPMGIFRRRRFAHRRQSAGSHGIYSAVPRGRMVDLQDRLAHSQLTRVLRCLLYTSPSPRDLSTSRMPSSA